MITVINNLNQSLTIGERSLEAGAAIRVKEADEEIKRLAAHGYVTILEDEVESKTDKETKK